jgi:hypothetical protein
MVRTRAHAPGFTIPPRFGGYETNTSVNGTEMIRLAVQAQLFNGSARRQWHTLAFVPHFDGLPDSPVRGPQGHWRDKVSIITRSVRKLVCALKISSLSNPEERGTRSIVSMAMWHKRLPKSCHFVPLFGRRLCRLLDVLDEHLANGNHLDWYAGALSVKSTES